MVAAGATPVPYLPLTPKQVSKPLLDLLKNGRSSNHREQLQIFPCALEDHVLLRQYGKLQDSLWGIPADIGSRGDCADFP